MLKQVYIGRAMLTAVISPTYTLNIIYPRYDVEDCDPGEQNKIQIQSSPEQQQVQGVNIACRFASQIAHISTVQ
jgi:hypothetical protein